MEGRTRSEGTRSKVMRKEEMKKEEAVKSTTSSKGKACVRLCREDQRLPWWNIGTAQHLDATTRKWGRSKGGALAKYATPTLGHVPLEGGKGYKGNCREHNVS